MPVLSVDDRTIGDGAIGPVTGRIVAAYNELVRSQGTPIQPRRSAREVVAGYLRLRRAGGRWVAPLHPPRAKYRRSASSVRDHGLPAIRGHQRRRDRADQCRHVPAERQRLKIHQTPPLTSS